MSFELRAGEILGLAGLVGSGRTELARVLFGLTPADAGDMRLRGQTRARALAAPRPCARGLAYVPEDRRRHGVIPRDVGRGQHDPGRRCDDVAAHGFLDCGREREIATAFVARFAIKTAVPRRRRSANLSGGNQQKVALARWLATRPSVLILDEPTQGVDVGAKAEIHRLIVELAAEGLAILMISSELPEMLGHERPRRR